MSQRAVLEYLRKHSNQIFTSAQLKQLMGGNTISTSLRKLRENSLVTFSYKNKKYLYKYKEAKQ